MGDLTPMEKIKRGICLACGEKGPHYVPPCFGDDGFYYCTETLVRGRRTGKGSRVETPPMWRANAETLVQRIIDHADDYGDLANTAGDDLRDALRVACEWLADARIVLVFADGLAVHNTGSGLADLYAEDYEPAQGALRRAGCWPRGSFDTPADISGDPK